MKLSELSVQYRESGEAIRRRVSMLGKRLEDEDVSDGEKLALRRRITVLTAMSREAIATSRFLENYYIRAKRTANSKPDGRTRS